MSASIAISIMGTLSPALGKSSGGNWRVKHEARATAREYATALWLEALVVDSPTGRGKSPQPNRPGLFKTPWGSIEVSVQQWYCGKALDPDGLAIRTAPYLDGAVHAGVITDDSWDVIQEYRLLRPVRVKHRSEAKTVVTIREAA